MKFEAGLVFAGFYRFLFALIVEDVLIILILSAEMKMSNTIISFLFYAMYFVCPIISFEMIPRAYNGGTRPTLRKRYQCQYPCRSYLGMAFDTFVTVSSSYEARCTSSNPIPPDAKNIQGQVLSLSDYMRLPVDQYVCIKMPLDAVLERDRSDSQLSTDSSLETNRFILTVPPGLV